MTPKRTPQPDAAEPTDRSTPHTAPDGATLHVLTPTWKPNGGVVKIMDYVAHARAMGYRVEVSCREPWSADLPLFTTKRFKPLARDEGIVFHTRRQLAIGPDDLVFMSLPIEYEPAYASLPRGRSSERIIHAIQNVRHITPEWTDGYALRLLTKPLSRISVNSVVGEVITPFLDPRALHRVIPLAHDIGYFAKKRTGGLFEDGAPRRPIRVAHMTWKSDVGDWTEAALDTDEFEFRAIRETVDWKPLRQLYHWADVFLAAPGPEEGHYLPGVEAMSAGALVVTPDVGGNMAYCRPDVNCLLVDYDDPASYAAALRRLRDLPDDEIAAMREAGYAEMPAFEAEVERASFGSFLEELWPRVRAFEAGAS